MLYFAVAVVVYLFTAADLLRSGSPASFREALGGALACALIAAAWPLALLWRGLLGGSGIRPVERPASVGEPSRTEV